MDYILKGHVTKAKNNDSKATEEILIKLRPLIVSSIRKYAKRDMDFEELLQEGYLEVLYAIQDFDESKGVPFLGYVKARLKYFYMNYIRGVKIVYSSLNSDIDMGDGTIEIIELLPDDSPDILEQYIVEEEKSELTRALAKLTEKQRNIIELYFYKDMPMTEIAKELNMHYMSVVKLKNRAVKKLKKILDDNEE